MYMTLDIIGTNINNPNNFNKNNSNDAILKKMYILINYSLINKTYMIA